MSQTQRMPRTGYRSYDFLDLNNQLGCVCAEYVPSRSTVYAALQSKFISFCSFALFVY